jgi:hypothetical protein
MEDHTPPNDSAQEPAAEHTNPSRGKSQTAFSVKPEELNNLGLIFNFTRTECKSWGPPAGEEAQFHSAANNFAEVIRKFLLDERVCFTSEVRHHDKLIPSIKRWFSHAKNNRHTERTFVHSIQLGQLATWTRSGKGGLCQTSYVCLIPHHQRPSSLHVYVVANSRWRQILEAHAQLLQTEKDDASLSLLEGEQRELVTPFSTAGLVRLWNSLGDGIMWQSVR